MYELASQMHQEPQTSAFRDDFDATPMPGAGPSWLADSGFGGGNFRWRQRRVLSLTPGRQTTTSGRNAHQRNLHLWLTAALCEGQLQFTEATPAQLNVAFGSPIRSVPTDP